MPRWTTDKMYAQYALRLYAHVQQDGIAYCNACGKPTNLHLPLDAPSGVEYAQFTIDHIDNNKENNNLDNHQVLCTSCNARKQRVKENEERKQGSANFAYIHSVRPAALTGSLGSTPSPDGNSPVRASANVRTNLRSRNYFSSGEDTNERRELSLRINSGIEEYGKRRLRDGPMVLDDFVDEASWEVRAMPRTVRDHLRGLTSGHVTAPFGRFESDGEKYIALKPDPQVHV